MININFMKPSYTRVEGTKLHLGFAFSYFSLTKDDEVYHFIPLEGKEIIIDIDTTRIENLSDTLVFQRGNEFIRMPIFKLLQLHNFHEHMEPLINKAKRDNSITPEDKNNVTLVAKVNFKGFSEPKSRYTSFYFKTDLDDLKKGDIVVVDYLDKHGAQQKANFLGYIDKNLLTTDPTKYIIKKADDKIEVNKKINMRTSEYRGTYNVRKETNSLMAEIMAFHKDNYIDKCLELGNYEDIHGVL